MSTELIRRVVVRHWVLLLVAALVGGSVALGWSKLQTRTYSATAQAFFSVDGADSTSGLSQAGTMVQDQMPSYTRVATSPIVLNPVISTLGLLESPKQLARSITATTPRDTVVMQITVLDEDPGRAAAIANEVVRSLGNTTTVVGPRLASGRPLVDVQSIQVAVAPTEPVAPKTKQNVLIGLVAGLGLSVMALLLVFRWGRVIRWPEAVSVRTDAPLLTSVPLAPAVEAVDTRAELERTAYSDAFRSLAATLDRPRLDESPNRVFLVSSPAGQEGKSTVARGLASALAERGRRTLLVCANLRSPSLVASVGATSPAGLTSIDPERALDQVISTDAGFDLLANEERSGSAVQLLSHPRVRAGLDVLGSQYECVVLDSPALLVHADASVLADKVDQCLFVVRSGTSRGQDLSDALRTAGRIGLPLPGVVLNGVTTTTVSMRLLGRVWSPGPRRRFTRSTSEPVWEQ